MELDMLKLREQDLEKIATIAQKQCFNSKVDRNTYIPLDKALYNYDEAMEKLDLVRQEITRKEGVKQSMEQCMGHAGTLEHQVAFKRDVERLKLYEIANQTGYSYEYIRQISRKVKRLRIAQ